MLTLPCPFHSCVSILLFTGAEGGTNEKNLLAELLDPKNYNLLERPVANENETLQVSFGLTLMQIIDVVSRTICFIYC